MDKTTLVSSGRYNSCCTERDVTILNVIVRKFFTVFFYVVIFLSLPAVQLHAQQMSEMVEEPDHIRGKISAVEGSSITVATKDGASVDIKLTDATTVLSLSEASFTDVDFGIYVGSVSKKLDEYSPIVRDSMSWLHEGYELRIFDEDLRGLALGHTTWDLTPESVISHGWVDDLEIRVISIKYGATEEEETDVRIERDKPVLYLKIGDTDQLQPEVSVFVGAQKKDGGGYEAEYIIAGVDGVVPGL
jgi:hypothetical protein